MKEVKYPLPHQVLWWDYSGDYYRYGIAYRDEIICTCCGAIEEIADVQEFAPEKIKPILEFGDWYDLGATDFSIMPKRYMISDEYTLEEIEYLATIYDQFKMVLDGVYF